MEVFWICVFLQLCKVLPMIPFASNRSVMSLGLKPWYLHTFQSLCPQVEQTILTSFNSMQLLCAYWRYFGASGGFLLCISSKDYCMVVETRASYSNFHFLDNLSTFCGDRRFFQSRGDLVDIIPSNRAKVTELSIINSDGQLIGLFRTIGRSF